MLPFFFCCLLRNFNIEYFVILFFYTIFATVNENGLKINFYMEKDLTIVSSKTAKELKDFGFDIICPNCYGVAVMHNGEYLGCDEEYELRAEGRGDEIEYIDYGMLYNMWFKNSDKEDHDVCAAPDIEIVRKWFRDKYSIHITAMPYITVEGCFWLSEVYDYNDVMYNKLPLTTMVCETYEEAIEKGIIKTVNYLKDKEKEDETL